MILKIDNYVITPGKFVAGTRGSYGIEPVTLELSREWDGLSVIVSFYPSSGDAVSLVYNGKPFYIPSEVMNISGNCKYVVGGYKDEKKLISVEGIIRVLNTQDPADNPANTPTPDTFSQIMAAAGQKAAIDHNHDDRYAAKNGVCPTLTAGFAESLVTEGLSEYMGILTGHEAAEGNTEADIFAGQVDSAEGMSICQKLGNGNFVDTLGWTPHSGMLSAENYTAKLKINPERMGQFKSFDYQIGVGETVAVEVDPTIYTLTPQKDGYVLIESNEQDYVFNVTGIRAGDVTLNVDDIEYGFAFNLNIRVSGDASSLDTGVYTEVNTVSGNKYYMRAEVKPPVRRSYCALTFDDGQAQDANLVFKEGWQKVSAVFEPVNGGITKVGISDRRTPSAVVKATGTYFESLDVVSVEKLLAATGVHKEGYHNFILKYYTDSWYICNAAGIRQHPVELEDYGIEYTEAANPSHTIEDTVITVKVDYPFNISATATLTASGNIGLKDCKIDADKFAGALGTDLASGEFVLKYADGVWTLNSRVVTLEQMGITGTAGGTAEQGAFVTVLLDVIPEEIEIRKFQLCCLDEMGLETMTCAQLDKIFGDEYHEEGIEGFRFGGVECMSQDGNIVGGGLHFTENYELHRLPDGCADRLDFKNGKLIKNIGMQFVTGKAGDVIALEGACTDSSCCMSDFGSPGTLTGGQLVLGRKMTGERVFYRLAVPEVTVIKQLSVYRIVPSGKEFAVSKKDSAYARASVCGTVKVRYLCDVGAQTETNRIFIRAFMVALGMTASSDPKITELAAEILSALETFKNKK